MKNARKHEAFFFFAKKPLDKGHKIMTLYKLPYDIMRKISYIYIVTLLLTNIIAVCACSKSANRETRAGCPWNRLRLIRGTPSAFRENTGIGTAQPRERAQRKPGKKNG